MPRRINTYSGWVYVLDSDIESFRDDDTRVYKIGRAKRLDARIKQLSTLYAFQPRITYAFQTENCFRDELLLHEMFAAQRLNGEWFKLDYGDIGIISEFANFSGYFEKENGELVKDPFQPHNENEALNAAIQELESDFIFSLRTKYTPWNASPLFKNDEEAIGDLAGAEYILQDIAEKFHTLRDERERMRQEDEELAVEEERERMYREDVEREISYRQERAVNNADDEDEDEEWNHEYIEESDYALIELIERIRTGREVCQ